MKKPTIAPNPQLVKVRTQGLQLVEPMRHSVESLTITDAETYLHADGLLGRIRNNRALWKQKMAPTLEPLKRAIEAAKEAEAGAKALFREVDTPMEQMELRVKEEMRQFKLEEQRQLQAAEEERKEHAYQIQKEAEALRRQEEAAKTAAMRARLAQKRADLEAQAEEVEQSVEDIAPVKGANSAPRKVSKVRITDLKAFLQSMEDYEPEAEIYRKGHPPVSLIKPEMLQVALNRILASQPGTLATWSGVEIYEDVIIAGR